MGFVADNMIGALKHSVRLIAYLLFRAKPLSKKEMRRIWRQAKVCCVLCASGIGDSLMATPLIDEIKRCNPGLRLVLVSTEIFAQVFERNPHVDAISTYGLRRYAIPSFMRMVWRLRKEEIDVLFAAQPANTIRHSLITAFSGAKIRLKHTYDYGTSRERDFSFVYHRLLPDNMNHHRVELNLDFLRFFGEEIEKNTVHPRYVLKGEAQDKIETWLKTENRRGYADGLIAIHPGGGRDNKRWVPEGFAVVGNELIKMGFTVCLVGGRDEKELCEMIGDTMDSEEVLNVAGKFSMEETAAFLTRCRCLLTNDTGIMHLATAVGTPVIVIFGPTEPKHIGPFSRRAKILFNSRNIENITPKEVLDTIIEETDTLHVHRC